MAIGWLGIVLGGLGLAVGLLLLVLLLAVPGAMAPGPGGPGGGPAGPQQADLIINAAANMMSGLWSVGSGILVLYGARKMKRLEGYGWAMAAAWLSVLPVFSPCCILGLVFGIQAIRALNDDEVKAAFDRPTDDDED
jgi:hypothetical protein